MQFLKLVSLLTLSVAVSAATFYHEHRTEDHVQDTSLAGGPHGTAVSALLPHMSLDSNICQFNDFSLVNAQSGHRRLSSITIGPCGGGSLSYIKFEFKDWSRQEAPVTVVEHGGISAGKSTATMVLEAGDRINKVHMEINKGNVGVKKKTRLSGIAFTNGGRKQISCGTFGNRDPVTWTAPEDRAFLYFSGASGNSIDNLMGHTIPLSDY